MVGDDNSAEVVIESMKKLIIRGCYSEATDHIKRVMGIIPFSENCFRMLIIFETLHYSNICYQDSEFDCYSVLHLHSSSSETEVKTRVEHLVNEIIDIQNFPGYFHALSLIHHSKSVICHKSLRSKLDARRRITILFEGSISSKKASFREDYLNWKPPTYCYDVTKLHRLVLRFMDMGLLSYAYPRFVNEKSPSSSSLCEEFRNVMSHVFDKMPQSPHYEMLSKVFQGKILEGMKLVLDVGYVELVEEIQKVESPEEFLERSEGFRNDLEQLSRNGYSVDKLIERFNALQRISEREAATRVATEKLEDEFYNLQKRLWECKKSIEKLNLGRLDLQKESGEVLSEFESTTQSSIWE